MGRKPSRWTNLPKGMRARPRGLKIFYYLDTGERPRKEIPLGSDYVLAVQKWAELSSSQKPAEAESTFGYAASRYWEEVLPGKAPRTQVDNEKELVWLKRFFDIPPAPLDSIKPVNVRQYLTWRVKEARAAAEARNEERVKAGKPPLPISKEIGQVRANREKSLLSHIFNFAREQGLTDAPNPCAGVSGFKEAGRDVYVDDELMDRVMQHAGAPLQFALKLAHLTGQRPADVLSMSEGHISDGMLQVKQGKTGSKVRIVIEGELKALLDEIHAFKTNLKVHALKLLVNEDGKPLTESMLRTRMDDAREAAGVSKAEFKFKDMRAKAATEADDAAGTRTAQALLGHTTEGMTAEYIRHKAGKKVRPLR